MEKITILGQPPRIIKNYLLLTKPWIVLGNLISAAGGFFLASKGHIDAALLAPLLVGIVLVVASAGVFNNYIDRHTDGIMERTKNRVLPKGLISPVAAVCYGLLLGTIGAALLWTETNRLCFYVVLLGFAIYVFIYTVCLKRTSEYSTLIGSLAGAAPPVAGYCAKSGGFDPGALILLLIFVLWQVPHSYAVGVFRFKDYLNASIPVYPVKHGISATKKHIMLYMLGFSLATLMLTLFGYTGFTYFAVAFIINILWFCLICLGFRTSDDRIWAEKLFISSLLIIIVLSVMMSVDTAGPVTSGELFVRVP